MRVAELGFVVWSPNSLSFSLSFRLQCPPPIICVASLNSVLESATELCLTGPSTLSLTEDPFVGHKCYSEIGTVYPAQPSNGRMISRGKEFWSPTKNLNKTRGRKCITFATIR